MLSTVTICAVTFTHNSGVQSEEYSFEIRLKATSIIYIEHTHSCIMVLVDIADKSHMEA